MKFKVKIIIIVLLVLGICGIAIKQTYAYYSNTDYYSVGSTTEKIGCYVEVRNSNGQDKFGYVTKVFSVGIRSGDFYSSTGYNYTLTIDGDADLLFGYNYEFDDHLTFTGTINRRSSSKDTYLVQFKVRDGGEYGRFDFNYNLECRQAY